MSASSHPEYAAVAVNFDEGKVLLDNGETLPITYRQDHSDGVHIIFVAGPTAAGKWLVFKIDPREWESLALTTKS